MVNFDPLAADIGLPVWGIPANFNGFHVLAARSGQVMEVNVALRNTDDQRQASQTML